MIKNYLLLGARQTYVAIVSILTSSILVSAFGVEGYGFYAYYLGLFSWIIFFGSAIGSTLQKNVAKQFYKGRHLDEAIQDNLSHYFSILFFFTPILLAILFVPASSFYSKNAELFDGASNVLMICFLLTTAIVSLFNTPNELLAVSFSNFKIGAISSVIESSLKLIFAITILFFIFTTSNKILFFSILLTLISVVIFFFLLNWVNKEYSKLGIKPKIKINKNILLRKDLFSFSSWNVIYVFSTIFCLQGMTILVGTFGQIDLVASHAVAVRLYGAIIAFVFAIATASIPKLVGELSSVSDNKKLTICKDAYMYCIVFGSAIWFLANLNQSWFTNFWFGSLVVIDDFFNALCLFGMLTTINRISIYILQSHDQQKMSSILSFLFILAGFITCNFLVYYQIIDIVFSQYLIFLFFLVPTVINFTYVLNINKIDNLRKIRFFVKFILAIMICCILVISPKLVELSFYTILVMNFVILFVFGYFVFKLLRVKADV